VVVPAAKMPTGFNATQIDMVVSGICNFCNFLP